MTTPRTFELALHRIFALSRLSFFGALVVEQSFFHSEGKLDFELY